MSERRPAPLSSIDPAAGAVVANVGDYRKAATTAGGHNSILDLPILTDIIVESELPRLAQA